MASEKSLHVLVVDDSAVVRRFLMTVLEQQRDITVATASDPYIAMRKMDKQKPDVIMLDIEMPRMDGLTFLRQIMADDPIPVVICSGYAGKGTRTALRALNQGAVDIVTKPTYGVQEFLQEAAVLLIDTVRAAAQAHLKPRLLGEAPARITADAILRKEKSSSGEFGTRGLVAIGASTGGPEALRSVLGAMPTNCPPIVVTQHMPEAFTGAFAKHLDQSSVIKVKLADEADRLLPGRALVAPGDRHLMIAGKNDDLWVRLIDGPLVSRHRPSADVLFRSAAQAAGPNAVGVIMTGMGDDGVQGLLEMRQKGAATMAQDEATCIVFGMPREAIERNAARDIVPLESIARWILKKCTARGEEGEIGSRRFGASV